MRRSGRLERLAYFKRHASEKAAYRKGFENGVVKGRKAQIDIDDRFYIMYEKDRIGWPYSIDIRMPLETSIATFVDKGFECRCVDENDPMLDYGLKEAREKAIFAFAEYLVNNGYAKLSIRRSESPTKYSDLFITTITADFIPDRRRMGDIERTKSHLFAYKDARLQQNFIDKWR